MRVWSRFNKSLPSVLFCCWAVCIISPFTHAGPCFYSLDGEQEVKTGAFSYENFGFWKKACPLPSRQSKPKGRTEISSCSRCHPVRKRQKTLSWNNHTGCISKCHIHASLFFQSRFELDLEITNSKCRCHTLSHMNLRRTCSILFFTPSLSSVVLQSLSVISTLLNHY